MYLFQCRCHFLSTVFSRVNANGKLTAGLLLFVGATQFILAVIFAQALDSSYSLSKPLMYLGGGPAGWLFNSSLFILGLLSFASAYFFWRSSSNMIFFVLFAITGLGLALVGIFNENTGSLHVFFVRTFMIFAIPTTILSYKFQKSPMSQISLVLGLIILIAEFFFLSGAYISPSFYLGLSRGTLQSLIIYPILLWMLGFGANLIGETALKQK